MLDRWLVPLGNLLLVGFALDGGLSLLGEILHALGDEPFLLPVRNLVATLVLWGAVVCFQVLWLSPRLPVAIFLLLTLSTFWLALGAVPLALMIESTSAVGVATAAIQILIAGAALLGIRRRNEGLGWLLRADSLRGARFSLAHSAVFTVGTVFVLIPAGILGCVLLIATTLELATQRFVSFDLEGVLLSDRTYVRADQEIRLVGMMHVGEEEAYRDLVRSFIAESTVVLEEGVTDEQKLLQVPLSYEAAAQAMGLEQQENLRGYLIDAPGEELPEWPVLRHADVDAAAFEPETLEFLTWMAGLWDSGDFPQFLQQLFARIANAEDEWASVEYDILHLRNENLVAEIDLALGEYKRVIVPWGALHLPFVELEIEDQGFVLRKRTDRRLVSWGTVLAALR